MRTVQQLFPLKSSPACAVAPHASALDALQQMEAQQLDSLLVVEGDHLVGIVTTGGYARKVTARNQSVNLLRVQDIMETGIPSVTPEDTCEECLEIMSRARAYSLPVVQGQRILGIISMQEVVQAVFVHQKGTIRFLEELELDYETV